MKIHDVKQGSGEWLELRAGIPTASEFDSIITPEGKSRTGEGVQTYLIQKIAEKCLKMPISAIRSEMVNNFAMQQGSLLEHEAIPWFELMSGLTVNRVGFCTTDDMGLGCSPDGLIGEYCGIEVKCPQPDTHLGYLLKGELPKKYWAQVYGSMFVTGRSNWFFLSYSRQFPALLVEAKMTTEIHASMKTVLGKFLAELNAGYAKVKAMKDAENAVKQAEYERA